jgi:salicylate biosynthesis isochorismate synthase
VLELVALLHPTPAVGGTPTAEAMAWIRREEGLGRGWYAAPIGWFDATGDGDFRVALRSALLDGRTARLYAGAGIVAGSDAAAELAETETKLRTMLDALGADP